MLCNDRAAIPAIRDLHFFGYLAALVVPARNKDLADEIRSVLGDPGLEINFVTEPLRMLYVTSSMVVRQRIIAVYHPCWVRIMSASSQPASRAMPSDLIWVWCVFRIEIKGFCSV